MKRLLAILLSALPVALPVSATADHLDVIEFKLNDGCSFDKYMEIAKDFNTQWGVNNGYRAEVLMPIQSQNLVSMYWVGRSKDAAAFGKAWDTWRTELGNPASVAAKLWARFQACSTNLSRQGYDVY
jgi:hypothetical protein